MFAPYPRLLNEQCIWSDKALLIVGWVANWRPLEVFLYDWRPLRLRQKLYDALSQMEIGFRPARDSIRTGTR